MGAVQKLATVVIVGLVALASVLVVYLADEPNRREAEAAEQEEVAIERAIDTYTANCVTCHGPGGEGLTANDGRIGYPLGGNTEFGRAQQELNQSEDPLERQERYDLIVETLHNGRGEDNAMPAWGRGAEGGALLNDEQIHELAVMIQNVDWDVVYNHVVEETAAQVAASGSPVPELGGVYPTALPQTPSAAAQRAAEGGTPAAADDGAPPDGGAPPAAQAPSVTIEAADIKWVYNGEESGPNRPLTVPVAAGATISVPNVGAIGHNFQADDFGINQDIAVGETIEVQIPADAQPGDYPFICNVPGHEAAMSGILRVEAAPAEAAAAPPAEGASPAEGAPPAAAPPGDGAAATTVTLEGVDIGWIYEGQQSAPGAPVNLTVAPGTTISLPNTGAIGHNFAVDALNIDQDMPAGETVEVLIPADAPPGDYEYYCNVAGHKPAGMVGTLTIQ